MKATRMFKRLQACLLMVALAAFQSSATASLVEDGAMTVAGTGTGGSSGSGISFMWTATPFASYVDFTSDQPFDLNLTFFTSNGSLSDVTGYILDQLDGPGGTPIARLTNDTNFANSAPSPLTGNTNLMGLPGATRGSLDIAEAGDTLLTNVAAGSYRLGVFDSATPSEATATFVIAAIPEPTAFLFGGVITAGLGVILSRRRR